MIESRSDGGVKRLPSTLAMILKTLSPQETDGMFSALYVALNDLTSAIWESNIRKEELRSIFVAFVLLNFCYDVSRPQAQNIPA